MTTLEILRYDWAKLKTQEGYADDIPKALVGLAEARSEEEALRFYWRIDNVVVLQGFLHEASVATAACAVRLLPSCTSAGRPWILELLFQLGSGKSPPALPHEEDLSRQCRREVLYGVALYLSMIERGTSEEASICIGLLVRCAFEDRRLLPRIDWIFRKLLSGDMEEGQRNALNHAVRAIGQFP